MKECSLYVHIPYCASKCIYCDFFSGGAGKADWKGYLSALTNELKERIEELPVCPDTLYIGGGTPSLIPALEFENLIINIQAITGRTCDWNEFTLEVNPDDVTEEKCRLWRRMGVNRVSMGIQSLNDEELKKIRRRHTSEIALKSYNILRSFYSNISLDLMFGLPGQTFDTWRNTVEKTLELHPEHISAYSLMLEEGTPLIVLHNTGRITLPDDDECDVMWQFLSRELGRAGYEQYEISNYCLSGYRSKHNSRYWSGQPYLGIGPSAHSYDGNKTRRANPCKLADYIASFSSANMNNKVNCQPVNYFYTEESLSDEELIEERILTRMRVMEGMDIEEFRRDFGEERFHHLMANASSLHEKGLIKIESGHLSLTHCGIMVADQVILQLNM